MESAERDTSFVILREKVVEKYLPPILRSSSTVPAAQEVLNQRNATKLSAKDNYLVAVQDSWAVRICGRERMIPRMDSSGLFYQVPPIMIQVWPLTVVKDCIFKRIRAFKLGDCDQKQASPPSCSMVGTSHMSSLSIAVFCW
ncbi:hypothetical protein MUK42_17438 [Musa troglodytarum]|uniref:Uncharacterized protein n=1 Tax=Musa troglodytarum TaxID=320322 RepID=A0A9E7HER7_9LILI|nr:hypothetical protein MUK42_17438 [Musa troglodytarum]